VIPLGTTKNEKGLVIRFATGQHGDAERRTFAAFISEPIAGSYQ
jgi:hypothetical protein